MSNRDARRHKYALMISAHRDQWAKFSFKEFTKRHKADQKAVKRIFSATSSPTEASKRIKSYFKTDAEAGWKAAMKTVWVETGNATIVYMQEFLTAKSAYVNQSYNPFSYTPSYVLGKMYNLQLKQDVQEVTNTWEQAVDDKIKGDGFKDKIVGINDTTEAKIHNTIADGVAEGKGHYEIGQDVEQNLEESWPGRGMTISRTEANSAMNQATLEDMKATVPDLWKTWSTTGMDNVRDWHAEVDGESIPQEEMFIVDGEEMNGPGDDSASPENLINCACCLLAEEPQAGTPLSDEEQARVDEEAQAAREEAPAEGETFTDYNDAEKAFKEYADTTLTAEQRESVTNYTTMTFRDINEYLQDPALYAKEYEPWKVEQTKALADNLRAITTGGPQFEGNVYRAAFTNNEDLFNYLLKGEGKEITLNGMTSTTTSKDAEAYIIDHMGRSGKEYMIQYEIANGKGAVIQPLSGITDINLQEVLIDSGNDYKIKSVEVIQRYTDPRIIDRKPEAVKVILEML